LIVLGFYIALQQFESNIVLPQVMNHTAHIPPLLSILALFAGGMIGGLLGAVVAIPLAGALKVLITSVAAP
jgi:predicted PurR-regulated permease PerM